MCFHWSSTFQGIQDLSGTLGQQSTNWAGMMSSEFKYSHMTQAFMLTPQILKAELEVPGMALALLMETPLCAGQEIAVGCSLWQPCELCRQLVELLEHAKFEGQRKCLQKYQFLTDVDLQMRLQTATYINELLLGA